jgi:hypothetical protein
MFFNFRYSGDTEFTSVNMQDQGDGMWNVTMTFDELTEIEFYLHAIANNGKEQYRPMTALEDGVNSFMYSFDECDTSECVSELDSNCSFDDVWEPVCGCDGVTYSNSGEAICNNIFEWTDGSCDGTISLDDLELVNRKLIKVIDITGKEVTSIYKAQVVFFIFSDGTIEQKIIN